MASERVSVSIVTPCYNGAAFLGETLASAIRQSMPPLEVIVIDDGSTDHSAAIAENFGPPVRVIRQPNQGESVARNRGIAEARGSHLLFLDADDLLEPDALAHLSAAVEGKPDAVALMGAAWFRSGEEPYERVEARYEQFYPQIIAENLGPPNCWLVPRHLVGAVGGFCETMRWFEDWDLWWRIGLRASALVPVAYVGALYRQHAQSQLATTKIADRTRGHAELMARMLTELLGNGPLLERYGDSLFWNAWTALQRARTNGIPWSELGSITDGLQRLARRGPDAVRGQRIARAIRWLGVRNTLAFHPR